jgi:hypothetical protein
VLLFLAAVYALGAFAASMAVTEGAETRLALAAHLYRLGLVLALALIVVSSTVRDMEGGFFQVLLAFPLSRAQFVVGRQAGYMLLAVLAAAGATGVMLSMAVPGGRAGVLAWGASLALELCIVVAAALFFHWACAACCRLMRAAARFTCGRGCSTWRALWRRTQSGRTPAHGTWWRAAPPSTCWAGCCRRWPVLRPRPGRLAGLCRARCLRCNAVGRSGMRRCARAPP